MKKILTAFIVFMIIADFVSAQTGDEVKVAEATELYRKALVDADKSLLESITASTLSYGHSSGKVENKAQFIEGVLTSPLDFLSINFSSQSITVTQNTAVVRHIFSAKTSTDGKPGEIKIGNMLVWQKQKGEWKLIARQAFKL